MFPYLWFSLLLFPCPNLIINDIKFTKRSKQFQNYIKYSHYNEFLKNYTLRAPLSLINTVEVRIKNMTTVPNINFIIRNINSYVRNNNCKLFILGKSRTLRRF